MSRITINKTSSFWKAYDVYVDRNPWDLSIQMVKFLYEEGDIEWTERYQYAHAVLLEYFDCLSLDEKFPKEDDIMHAEQIWAD
jgi:hypothetical protein